MDDPLPLPGRPLTTSGPLGPLPLLNFSAIFYLFHKFESKQNLKHRIFSGHFLSCWFNIKYWFGERRKNCNFLFGFCHCTKLSECHISDRKTVFRFQNWIQPNIKMNLQAYLSWPFSHATFLRVTVLHVTRGRFHHHLCPTFSSSQGSQTCGMPTVFCNPCSGSFIKLMK